MGDLTALGVKAATAAGRYRDGDGLMLWVKPSGARSWVLRVQVDGRRRDFGLGSLSEVPLAEAREKAAALRKQCRSGIDPVAAKRAERLAQRETPTFRSAAEQAHNEQKSAWRNAKHREQWISSLRAYAFPTLGDMRVDLIDSPMIRAMLLPIWLDKPETARRVRQRVAAVLDWAHASGFRAQEAPMRSVNKGLPRQPKRDNHFAAMAYADVPQFCRDTEAAASTVGRLALLFTIYTAARSGEVRGAAWDEIDLEAATWTVPAARMKAHREHIVPLSPATVALLERAKAHRKSDESDAVIFSGTAGQPLSDMTLSKVLRDAKIKVTVHGFRSAFKDWASEMTAFPDAVSEAALAHGDPDKVRRAYRRTDFLQLRRDMMGAWASYILAIGDNVVRFPGKAEGSAV